MKGDQIVMGFIPNIVFWTTHVLGKPTQIKAGTPSSIQAFSQFPGDKS